MDFRLHQRSREWRDEVEELKKSFFSNTSLHLLKPPNRQYSNPNQSYLKSFSRLNSLASLPNIQSHLTRSSTDHLKTSTSSTDNLSEPQSSFSPTSSLSSSSSFPFNNDASQVEIPVTDEAQLNDPLDKTLLNKNQSCSLSSSSLSSSTSSRFHQEFDMASYQASEITVIVLGRKLRIEACHSQTGNKQSTKRRTKREMDLPEGTNVSLLKSVFKRGTLIIFEDKQNSNMMNGFVKKIENTTYVNEVFEDQPEVQQKHLPRSSNFRRSLSQPNRPTKPHLPTASINFHCPDQVINQPINPLYFQKHQPHDMHLSRNFHTRHQNFINPQNKETSIDDLKKKIQKNRNFDFDVSKEYKHKQLAMHPASKRNFNGFNTENDNYINDKLNKILNENMDFKKSQNSFSSLEANHKVSLPDVVGSLGSRKEKEEKKHEEMASQKHEAKESSSFKNDLMNSVDLKKHPSSKIELTINTRPFNTTLKVGPGVEPQHLRIDAIDDVLIVSINNHFKSFSYTINLPFGLDPANVSAHLSDLGFLTLEEVA